MVLGDKSEMLLWPPNGPPNVCVWLTAEHEGGARDKVNNLEPIAVTYKLMLDTKKKKVQAI